MTIIKTDLGMALSIFLEGQSEFCPHKPVLKDHAAHFGVVKIYGPGANLHCDSGNIAPGFCDQ